MNETVWLHQGRLPVTVIQTHGDLDASNYRDLIAVAREAYEGGAQDILLDLSDTPYMSSSGLVALQSIAALLQGGEPPDPEAGWSALHAVDRHREAGPNPHFKLLSPQPRVDKVLDMTGFKQFLEVYTDLDSAVASF
jgi:anti-anti-sigma regulatory factor